MKVRILVNNAINVEDYLNLSAWKGKRLKYVDLKKNRHIKGVKKLVKMIPSGFDKAEMEKFYNDTGLIMRVELFNSEWEYEMYDRHGRYPHEGLHVNSPMVKHIDEHPEWLEPQEEADLIVRYVEPIKKG